MTTTPWDQSYQIVSIISVIASGMVVLTLVLFKNMRSKLFMRMIANISLADIMGNMPYATLYRPKNGELWCSLQGFLNIYSYPCSWMWTTMLVRFLYDLAIYQRIRISFRVAFLICWGVPLIVTLLYFAFIPHGTFQRHSGNSSDPFCTYGGSGNLGYAWHVTSYYGMYVACVVYMTYLYTEIRKAYAVEAKNQQTISGDRESGVSTTSSAILNGMQLTSDSLLLNPILMIVLWVPHIIAVIIDEFMINGAVKDFGHMGLNLKIMHGFATAVLFFYKSQVARDLWVRLLFCRYKFKKTEAEELDEQAMYRESETSVADYRMSYMVSPPSITSLAIANPLSRTVTLGNDEL